MKEIRIHGRGGQGAVMGGEILVTGFVLEGKYSNALPMFGFERRGAPVSSSVRFDAQPVREKTQVYSADCLIILDPPQAELPSTFAGLKPQGVLILNNLSLLETPPHKSLEVIGIVDATGIALIEIGIVLYDSYAGNCHWSKEEFSARWAEMLLV
jgi:2-oxoacid:acceptor oxidoreductase gamma subunit (pyruvate/2-ketoisovalerate family)